MFVVQPGRGTGFLGPNGAGKSTAMKLLLDLARPSGGHTSIGGHRYRELAAARGTQREARAP